MSVDKSDAVPGAYAQRVLGIDLGHKPDTSHAVAVRFTPAKSHPIDVTIDIRPHDPDAVARVFERSVAAMAKQAAELQDRIACSYMFQTAPHAELDAVFGAMPVSAPPFTPGHHVTDAAFGDGEVTHCDASETSIAFDGGPVTLDTTEAVRRLTGIVSMIRRKPECDNRWPGRAEHHAALGYPETYVADCASVTQRVRYGLACRECSDRLDRWDCRYSAQRAPDGLTSYLCRPCGMKRIGLGPAGRG